MEMRAYQQWLEAWDKARGWDRVSPSHTLVHAMEELGEVSRLGAAVGRLQGRREPRAAAPRSWKRSFRTSSCSCSSWLINWASTWKPPWSRGQAKAEGRYEDLAEAAGRCWTAIMPRQVELIDAHHARRRRRDARTIRRRCEYIRKSRCMSSDAKPLSFQEVIMRLQAYWAEQGCLIWQPYSEKVGAGTAQPGHRAARAGS